MSCIFCGAVSTTETVAHIFPQSLGGSDWAVLPGGLECAKCDQYFGSKVEPLALGSFPLLPIRVMMQIPTAKGKAPKQETYLGMLRATGMPGTLGIDPADSRVEAAITAGRSTQVRLLAECTEPLATARMLLKMGIEVIARDDPTIARSNRYDDARSFARAPKSGSTWWFLIATDHERLFATFQRGVSVADWVNWISVEICEDAGAEMCVLRLLDMTLMCPMHAHIFPPDMTALPEPELRLITARA